MTDYPCPLCGSCSAEVVFERRNMPVHQNVVCETAGEARSFPRGDVILAFCQECSFVFNRAFDLQRLNYSAIYDNSQAHSPIFRQYLGKLRDYLQAKYELRGKQIIEVGCGKGDFLRLMCVNGTNRGLGFDPSYVGPAIAEHGAVRFIRAFYGDSHRDWAPDLLCLRHVLEHIAYPTKMLAAVRNALGDHTDSAIYIEVPDLTWILDRAVFWDLFYEHCSYFTAKTLALSCQAAGFEVVTIFSAFAGQYLCLEAKPSSGRLVHPGPTGNELVDLRKKIRSFRKLESARVQECSNRVAGLQERGRCALWGAAAKGATFANVIDPDGHYIRCLIDINPSKRSKFIAGSGHRIIAPEEISSCAGDLRAILSMNSNYFEEQRTKLAELSLNIPLIPL
jgi:hypothetical protein